MWGGGHFHEPDRRSSLVTLCPKWPGNLLKEKYSVVLELAESFTQVPSITPTRPIYLKLSIALCTEFTSGLPFVTGMLSTGPPLGPMYNSVVVGKAVCMFSVPNAWSHHLHAVGEFRRSALVP